MGTQVLGPNARRSLVASAAALLLGMLILAPAAPAASTQRINLGKGTIGAPATTWKATAVPRGAILVDMFNRRGIKLRTYGSMYERSFRSRAMEMTGIRVERLPSRQAVVMGATGRQIRKVKLFIRGSRRARVVRTVPAPADWGVRNRLFAVAFNVPASQKRALKVVTKIQGLNARGRVLKTLRGAQIRFDAY